MNSLNHIDCQSDILVEPRNTSGVLSGREVMQMEHDAARDVQDIFSQTMAKSGPFQPSFPTGLPSGSAEVDLTSFGLDLSDVDLSAQLSASQPAERLDFQQLQPSGATTWPQDTQAWQGFSGLAIGNHGSTSALPPDFYDQGGLDFQQGQPSGATTWLQDAQAGQGYAGLAVGNHGPTSALPPDFFDDLLAAAPAAVGQPAGPLLGAAVEQREAALDLNWEQTSSQEDRDLGEFLLDGGYDPDQFSFEPQVQSALPSNHRPTSRYLIYHDAAKQWDVGKNGPIGCRTCGMTQVVWWKCEEGHEWEARIESRCKRDKPSSCPVCKPRKKEYLKDHAAKDQWDVDKNGPIKDETCGMEKRVWWRCKKGHEWERSIKDRCVKETPSSCPECLSGRRRLLKDHAAKDQWDVDKNGPIGSRVCSMKDVVWWKCEAGHEWEARIESRCKRDKPSPCPECKPRKKRYLRDHAAKDQWNRERNGPINNETCGMDRAVWWKCEKDHEWKARIDSRCAKEIPSSCPVCKPRKKKYLKDHAAKDQWDADKNGPINNETCGMRTVVWWKCEKGHEWKASIKERCMGKKPSSCVICKPKKYLREHLASAEWDVAKNGPIKDETCGLRKLVWWKCKEGHEWEASIHNRCRGKKPSACPECKTKKKKRAAEEPLEDQPAQKRQR